LVPQDLALYPTLSARVNLNFFGRIYGLRGKELKDRVEDVLRIVALTDRADQAVDKYSGGMKRRVNIAAGLVHHPQLLFLDEPTVGVDPQSRNHIFESVLRLNRERGMSVVYTSHYMEEVELLCNRVAIIDEGSIIAMDTVKNLIGLLGGGIIYVGLERVDDALLEQLSQLQGVQEAVLTPQPVNPPPPEGQNPETETEPVLPTPVVKIVAENSQQAVINVISFLNEQDRQLTSLEILEPNLESVFLHLTGKKLRE
jgi:ABC-2 type transport system ATP-binding protein